VGFENYNTVKDYFQFGKSKPTKSGIHHPARSHRDNKGIAIGLKTKFCDQCFARISSAKGFIRQDLQDQSDCFFRCCSSVPTFQYSIQSIIPIFEVSRRVRRGAEKY
jgi:hypothetical protein